MSSASQTTSLVESSDTGPLIAWRWVHVGVAALTMVAALPGRTHGLGLFTELVYSVAHSSAILF